MLENAACQEITSLTPSSHHIVRSTLRTLTLKLLHSEVCRSNSAVAAENLLRVSQLLMTELLDWNVVLRSSGYNATSTQDEVSHQRLLSWVMARFGEIPLPAFELT
jgi:hypothetical protein